MCFQTLYSKSSQSPLESLVKRLNSSFGRGNQDDFFELHGSRKSDNTYIVL